MSGTGLLDALVHWLHCVAGEIIQKEGAVLYDEQLYGILGPFRYGDSLGQCPVIPANFLVFDMQVADRYWPKEMSLAHFEKKYEIFYLETACHTVFNDTYTF